MYYKPHIKKVNETKEMEQEITIDKIIESQGVKPAIQEEKLLRPKIAAIPSITYKPNRKELEQSIFMRDDTISCNRAYLKDIIEEAQYKARKYGVDPLTIDIEYIVEALGLNLSDDEEKISALTPEQILRQAYGGKTKTDIALEKTATALKDLAGLAAETVGLSVSIAGYTAKTMAETAGTCTGYIAKKSASALYVGAQATGKLTAAGAYYTGRTIGRTAKHSAAALAKVTGQAAKNTYTHLTKDMLQRSEVMSLCRGFVNIFRRKPTQTDVSQSDDSAEVKSLLAKFVASQKETTVACTQHDQTEEDAIKRLLAEHSAKSKIKVLFR